MAAAVAARFADFTMAFPMWGVFSFGIALRLDGAVLGFSLGLVALRASPPACPRALRIVTGARADSGRRDGRRRNAQERAPQRAGHRPGCDLHPGAGGHAYLPARSFTTCATPISGSPRAISWRSMSSCRPKDMTSRGVRSSTIPCAARSPRYRAYKESRLTRICRVLGSNSRVPVQLTRHAKPIPVGHMRSMARTLRPSATRS